MAGDPDREQLLKALQQTLPSQSEHLLQVVHAISRDASGVWAALWEQFRPHVTAAGTVDPTLEKGFVPACGWAEFLENFWLLKHHLDSVSRICEE